MKMNKKSEGSLIYSVFIHHQSMIMYIWSRNYKSSGVSSRVKEKHALRICSADTRWVLTKEGNGGPEKERQVELGLAATKKRR